MNVNPTIYDKPMGWGLLEDLLNFDLNLYCDVLPKMSEAFTANREYMIEYFCTHAERFITEFKRGKSESFLASLKGGVDDFEKALNKYKEDIPKWESNYGNKDPVTLQICDSVPNFLSGMQKI